MASFRHLAERALLGPVARVVPAQLQPFFQRALAAAVRHLPVLDPTSPASVAVKNQAELDFWRDWLGRHGTAPATEYYRSFMMAMGGIADQDFFTGRVCVDLGCGPSGSLTWLDNAKAAIGVDPLAESYRQFGIDAHPMLYLACGAERLPFPTGYVDVVFSMNSLDHTDDVPAVCREIRRVLKPGGHFIGSLNLNEPPTSTEPWMLTEELLAEHLFAGWQRQFYKVRPKLEHEPDPYRYFHEEPPPNDLPSDGPQALWCRYQAV